MKTGLRLTIVAMLGTASAPAHAHGIPVWMFVWVTLFWRASNHNETTLLGLPTDYVIWAALALYVLHALILVGLVIIHSSRRWRAT